MKRISITLSDTDVKLLAELARAEPGKGIHAWELASKTGKNVHTVISALEKLERLQVLSARREKNDQNVGRVAYDLTGSVRGILEASLSQGLQIIRTALILETQYPRASMKEALAAGYLAHRRLSYASVLSVGPDNVREIRDELTSFYDGLGLTVRELKKKG